MIACLVSGLKLNATSLVGSKGSKYFTSDTSRAYPHYANHIVDIKMNFMCISD
jgi:hypothetical protein